MAHLRTEIVFFLLSFGCSSKFSIANHFETDFLDLTFIGAAQNANAEHCKHMEFLPSLVFATAIF